MNSGIEIRYAPESTTFLTCADRLSLGEHDLIQELIESEEVMIRSNGFEVEEFLLKSRKECVG